MAIVRKTSSHGLSETKISICIYKIIKYLIMINTFTEGDMKIPNVGELKKCVFPVRLKSVSQCYQALTLVLINTVMTTSFSITSHMLYKSFLFRARFLLIRFPKQGYIASSLKLKIRIPSKQIYVF